VPVRPAVGFDLSVGSCVWPRELASRRSSTINARAQLLRLMSLARIKIQVCSKFFCESRIGRKYTPFSHPQRMLTGVANDGSTIRYQQESTHD